MRLISPMRSLRVAVYTVELGLQIASGVLFFVALLAAALEGVRALKHYAYAQEHAAAFLIAALGLYAASWLLGWHAKRRESRH